MNRDDLRDFYRAAAEAEGWIVLAGDGESPPSRDTAGWRAGMTLAALDALHSSFPGSKNWPIAVAGFSGGAKRAGNLAPVLALAGNRVIGIFLTGINEDRLSEGYRTFRPGRRVSADADLPQQRPAGHGCADHRPASGQAQDGTHRIHARATGDHATRSRGQPQRRPRSVALVS